MTQETKSRFITGLGVLFFILGAVQTSLFEWLPLFPEEAGPRAMIQNLIGGEEGTIFILGAMGFGLIFAPLFPMLAIGIYLVPLAIFQNQSSWNEDPELKKHTIYYASLIRKVLRWMFCFMAGMALSSLWLGWETLAFAAFFTVILLEMVWGFNWFIRRYKIPLVENPPRPGKQPAFMWIFTGTQFDDKEEDVDEENAYWLEGVEEEGQPKE